MAVGSNQKNTSKPEREKRSKVHVITYGCTANQNHTEIMEGLLSQTGFVLVETPAKADAIIVNSCIVKLQTENKVLSKIKFLRQQFPHKKIVVAGCMPNAELDLIQKTAPKASVLGTHNVTDVVEVVEKTLSGETVKKVEEKREPKNLLPKKRKNPLIGVVEISQGCLGKCTFCIVKNARGKLFSYSVKDIVKEVESCVSSGCREIQLTSQDCGVYGWDQDGVLSGLLNELTSIHGDFKIRVGMMDPFAALKQGKELVQAFNNPKVYAFVHLPVQSGSDSVLRKMKRKYKVAQFEQVVNSFRQILPEPTISTDVIVGFPGETRKDFQATLELLKRVKPEITNVSMFYPRPGTEAKQMKLLPTSVIKDRSRECSALTSKISLEQNQTHVGKQYDVRVLQKGRKGGWVARLPNYKQAVLKEASPGEKTRVEIVKAHSRYLEAKPV
jgi:MiaB-like tRNA modifying enzyme